MKITKKHISALKEIHELADSNGCIYASDWTSGYGRYTKKRRIPPFCVEFAKTYIVNKSEFNSIERIAYNFFEENGRCQKVIIINYKLIIDSLHNIEI